MPEGAYFGTNSLVQQYRGWYRQQHAGADDPRQDRDITVWLGDQLRSRGDTETEERFPDFREHYLDLTQGATDRGVVGETGAALRRGGRGLVGTAAGAVGLAADWLPDALVDPTTARGILDYAREKLDDGGVDRPRVQRFGDIRSVDTAVDYVAGKVGEAAPSIGEAIVTGTIGAVAGSAASPAGTVAGGVAGVLGKTAIKNLIRKGVREAVEFGTEQGVKRALLAGTNEGLKRAFTMEVRALGARMGGAAASGLNAYALSAGEIYGELGADESLEPGQAREVATLFGIPAALADTALPTYIVGKFFRGAAAEAVGEAIKPKASYFRRLLKELPITMGGEGATESFQELVNIAAEKFARGEAPTLSAADEERILEAGISGVAGGSLGAPVAAAGGGGAVGREAGSGKRGAASPSMRPPPVVAAPTAGTAAPTAPVIRTPTAAAPPAPAITLAQVVTMDEAGQRARLGELEARPSRSPEEDRQRVYLRAKFVAAMPAMAPPAATEPGEVVTGGAPAPVTPITLSGAVAGAGNDPAGSILGSPAGQGTSLPAAAPDLTPMPAAPSVAPSAVLPVAAPLETPGTAPVETPPAAVGQPAVAAQPPAAAPAAVAPPAGKPTFGFGGVTLDSADFRSEARPEGDALLGEGTGSHKGSRTQSRAVLVLHNTQTGAVHVRTANRYNKGEGLRRLDGLPGARNSTGISISGMGRLAGKTKESKVFDPAGNQQVLLEDLERQGLKVIARLNLPAPGVVNQDFATLDAFDSAWAAAEKLPGRALGTGNIVSGTDAIAAAEAAAASGNTGDPASREIVLEDADNAAKAGGLVVTKVEPPAAPAAVVPAPAAAPDGVTEERGKMRASEIEKEFAFLGELLGADQKGEQRRVRAGQQMDVTVQTGGKVNIPPVYSDATVRYMVALSPQGRAVRYLGTSSNPQDIMAHSGLPADRPLTPNHAIAVLDLTGDHRRLRIYMPAKVAAASAALPQSTAALTAEEAAAAVGIDVVGRLYTNLKKIADPRRRSTLLQGMLVEGQYPEIRAFVEENPGRGALNAVLGAVNSVGQAPADAVARTAAPEDEAAWRRANPRGEAEGLKEYVERMHSALGQAASTPAEAQEREGRIAQLKKELADLVARGERGFKGDLEARERWTRQKRRVEWFIADAERLYRTNAPAFALGVVDSYGAVRSVPRTSSEHLANSMHSLLFPGVGGRRWRYRQGQVQWWEAPTVDERLAVEGHLSRAGATVTRHYDMGGGQFYDALAARTDPTDPGRPLSERETRFFERTLIALKQAGVDVRLLQPLLAQLQGLARDQLGYYSRAENAVALVVDDITQPRIQHLLTLLHETAHYQFGQLDPVVRRRLTAAVGRVNQTMIARLGTGATKLENPEEFLVESVAAGLAAEGFSESRSMAEHLWARLKEFYLAAVLAVRQLFQMPASPALATAFLQARVANFLHAPYDASAAASPRRLVPHKFFRRVDELAPDDAFDPLSREVVRPDLLPETPAAVAVNREWARLVRELPADLQARTAGAPPNAPYRVASARMDVAALTDLQTATSMVFATIQPKGLTIEQFFAKVGRGTYPQEVIDAIVALEPDAAGAVRGGDLMTGAMNDQAAFKALRLLELLRRTARTRAGQRERQANTRADELADLATGVHDLESRFRDADAHNAELVKRLRGAITNLARIMRDGLAAAESKGDLAATIREFEKLREDDPIPADYQRVFKALMENKTLSVFDYFQEIAKLGLDLGATKIADLRVAVEQAAAGNATLKKLVEQRPLFAAVVSLARNAQREMDLLALRVLRNQEQFGEIYADLEKIRNAGEAELATMAETAAQAGGARSLRDRLKADYLRVRRAMRQAEQAITRALADVALQRRTADLLGEPIKRFYEEVGNRPTWEPAHGATFITYGRDASGAWKRSDLELQMAGDTISQADRIDAALQSNRRWLEETRADSGTPLWQLVKSQTDKLGLVDFRKKYEASHRFLADRLLQALGEKFASAGGVAGASLAARLKRYVFLTRTHLDSGQASGHQWAKALQDTAKAAGYGTRWRAFLKDVYDPMIHTLENEPGLADDDSAAMRRAHDVAMEHVADPLQVDRGAWREALARLLELTKRNSEREVKVANDNGVFVEDERLAVENPLTGDREFIKRHRIRQGWLTVPRRLRRELIELLDVEMQRVGWGDPEKFDQVSALLLAREQAGEPFDPAVFDQAVAGWFTPDVVRDFVEPFVNKPGRSAFPGVPLKGTDRRVNLDQTQVQAAWEAARAADGTVSLGGFITGLASTAPGDVDLNAYAKQVLKQFERLYLMEHRLAQRTRRPTSLFDQSAGPNHRMIEARTNELLPAEHLEYDSYDPQSNRMHLAELAFHAAFGRGAEGFDADLQALELELSGKANFHRAISTLSREDQAAEAKRRGYDLRTLERAAAAAAQLPDWRKQMEAQFSYGNNAGMVGDAQLGMEALHFATMMILNQPKSGLWNFLSIGDFPLVLGGVNASSVRAMGVATGDLAKGVFGSFLEGIGLQLLKSSDYSKDLGELIDHTQLHALTSKELWADTGMAGRFDQNKRTKVVRFIRQLRSIMGKGVAVRDVGEKEFATFNAIWAPFNFLGNRMVHGVALGNVEAYERIVRKAVEYFENHAAAHDDPAFRFTAAQLGMDGKFFFNERGAFDYYRDKSLEYGLGRIEDVARQVRRRRTEAGTNARVLSKEQVHMLGLMAMTEVSLESNLNSRPSELATNPVLKYTFPLLGWPLAKMNQVHRMLKTREGQVEWRAAMRGLGTLAMWSLPVGLAYTFAMDEYDEEVLGKKSNQRAVDPAFIVPLIGPVISAMGGTEHGFWENATASLERVARAGNAYGLGGDLINSMVNVVDPTAGQRDFSLDNRVLVMSMLGNAFDAMRNFVHQDATATYASVGRPIVTLLGGQSVLQYTQILNKVFGADNAESRVTASINAANHLRAAGRAAGLELRSGGGSSTPTPVSVWVREMQYAAYANDRTEFLQAYRNAVAAARKEGREDPEQSVLQSWRSRHLLVSTFRARPTDAEERQLFAEMDEDGVTAVRYAVRQHELFGRMIEPAPQATNPLTLVNRLQRRVLVRTPAPLR